MILLPELSESLHGRKLVQEDSHLYMMVPKINASTNQLQKKAKDVASSSILATPKGCLVVGAVGAHHFGIMGEPWKILTR